MELELEQHGEMFFVLPTIGITHGECSDPACRANHWRISFGWFVWSAHISF